MFDLSIARGRKIHESIGYIRLHLIWLVHPLGHSVCKLLREERVDLTYRNTLSHDRSRQHLDKHELNTSWSIAVLFHQPATRSAAEQKDQHYS